jgi:nucleoside-diphosphate-sugar epimerase
MVPTHLQLDPDRRCLLTGGSGYVGSRIRARLMADGWSVTELTRKPNSQESIKFHLGDPIDLDRLRGHHALIHCAYDFSNRDPQGIYDVNVRGSELLLKAAHDAGVSRLVVISTMSAFPGCRSLYGNAKLEIECIGQSLGAWVLRPGLVYGDHAGGMFGRLVTLIKMVRVIPIPGMGQQVLYLLHEADLCQSVLRCLSLAHAPRMSITLANEKPWRFRSILKAVAQKLNKKLVMVPVPPLAMMAILLLSERLKIRLGLSSDSFLSLLHQDKSPTFNARELIGTEFRSFQTFTK